MATCSFDWSLFADIFSSAIALLNLVAVIVFFVFEGKRIKKIQKHHTSEMWYSTFELPKKIQLLLTSSSEYKRSLEKLLDDSITREKILEIKSAFDDKRKEFKSFYLDVIAAIDISSVGLFTDEIDVVNEISVRMAEETFDSELSVEDKKAHLDAEFASLKSQIIKIGVDLSSFK